ncbi:hypothetical protein GEM_0163 [Burkholderia cepacia GG4]|uniref:Uncharacterized protein n=1 Tax=Burkholderia cepacia GG4 TaxID=1009846 RepID=A0A9W3JZC4_BURCE|nr:hypothetical protein [Burkholderia cepacia]AFQ46623.1 hypothetical protein GEM_0163 [Burkholderia cepacia GG4]
MFPDVRKHPEEVLDGELPGYEVRALRDLFMKRVMEGDGWVVFYLQERATPTTSSFVELVWDYRARARNQSCPKTQLNLKSSRISSAAKSCA